MKLHQAQEAIEKWLSNRGATISKWLVKTHFKGNFVSAKVLALLADSSEIELEFEIRTDLPGLFLKKSFPSWFLQLFAEDIDLFMDEEEELEDEPIPDCDKIY